MMTRVMGASGAESLNVAASIFMGQTEAPLTIRPFLNKLTKSELMCVMTSGMAHVSGGIMAAYIAFGVEAKHLLAAVIMTAPGTLSREVLSPEEAKRSTRACATGGRPRTSQRGTTDLLPRAGPASLPLLPVRISVPLCLMPWYVSCSAVGARRFAQSSRLLTGAGAL